MDTSFPPTQGENALVNQIFNKHDPQKLGIITSEVAIEAFSRAHVHPTILGQIWGIADTDKQGFLTRKGVSIAVRLIGYAQKGEVITGDLANKPGPLAVFDGFSSSSEPRRAVSPPPTSSRLPPPLSPQDKAKFTRLFNNCGPINGIVSGEKAREVFIKSKLPFEKLSQIWNLSDTHKRGSMDVADFIVAMYLIQASMTGQLTFVPTTLPPGLYEVASGTGLPGTTVTSHATGNSGSFSPGLSTTFAQNSVVQPQMTGRPLQPQYSGQPLQQQFTGQLAQHQTGSKPALSRNTPATPLFPPPSSVQSQMAWDVTPAEKANADKYFETLDTHRRGYIEADVAVPFMLQSKLPQEVLAVVWDLADLNDDGRLTRDGFAVACHLIQGKIAGKDIPTTLPASLMPPSMRTATVSATSPFHQPASEPLGDLIWDDHPSSPAMPQSQSSIFQPQITGSLSPQSTFSPSQVSASQTQGQGIFGPPVPNKNLLDDDEDAGTGAPSSAIHDHSAEIGNLQNQLQSTNRSLENTKTERSNLEGTVESQKIQLSTLQTQLSSAKAAYETETRLLSTLRDRFTSQSSDIQKAREELIRSESDLSAIRVDKAEVEQNFLRDKEEIRELQRKMTETGSMIEVAKVEIEKAKKDAKQQKGLLAIAKKQLAARESERAKVEQELQESLVEAAETREELDASEAELARDPPTATTTNGFTLAPSPTLSGDSTSFASAKPLPGSPGSPSSINGPASAKSNNPFERLTAGSGSASRSQSPFLPLASSSTPAPNEGTTTDNPFTFDQAFGSEEAGPVSDVDGTSIGTEGTVQPSVPKIVGELNIVTNDLSSPSSERDLFSTPPMTGLDTLASGARTSTVDPDAVNLSASGTTSAAPSTDRSGEAHTNINAPLKELDGNESDSSDENSEDETPLANLAKRPPPPPNKVDLKVNAPKEAPVTNGHALPQSKVESPFPPVPVPIPPADAKSANAFPPAPAHPSATSPFAVSSETRKSTNVNDFDKAFGNLAGDARATTENNLSSFDAVFEDQFDFSTSTSLPAADPSSSGSTTFPPAPANLSGTVKRSASGFENAFTPQQSAMTPTAPTSSIEGLPPLPQIPESKPFSFDDAFSSISHEPKPFSFEDAFSTPAPALSPPLAASLTSTALSSQPPPNAEAQSLSLEDASGSNMTRGDSGFATISSRSSIPPVTQSPISALASGSPVRNSTSPRDSLSFPTSQSRQDSPPPVRVTSPRRPTTSSSEKSVDKNKDQGRHSKISMIRLPFGKRKKTQESLPPSQHLSPIVDDNVGRASPDDAEAVKQLCSMGFNRGQAVTALEANSYDFQRALNSLLSA